MTCERSVIKKNDFSNIKYLIFSNIISGVVVLLLYSPIFAVTGAEALYNNRFVAPIPRMDVIDKLPHHFSSLVEYLFDADSLIFLGLFFGALLACLVGRKHQIKLTLLSLYCLVMPLILVIVHSVLPFYRTWIYLVIPALCLIGIVINTTKINSKIFVFLLISICLFHIQSVRNLDQKIQTKFSTSTDNPWDLKQVFLYVKPEAIHCNYINVAPLSHTYLEYYRQVENMKMEITFSNLNPSYFRNMLINNSIDYVLLDEKIDGLAEYDFDKSFGQDLFLYKRKEDIKSD